ncbi:glycosyltransferase family 4 protein [Aliifodinibius salicampi]|uniref:Glycosyltransferase family 4 protein n=1 Tax=Fodinibius salicampi TaxID=1920655 RepID=A0ABT3PZ17_9BACT|nr:glycosyltransferase family 4 protein [Fodinibius salicampi]MCW9713073.1 glycosyltransferase family 4 protein [Fodinibius salicampi]
MGKKILITLDGRALATGMALNEFTAYRANKYPDESHHFIALGPHTKLEEETRDLKGYHNVKFYDCKGKLLAIPKFINEIIEVEKEYSNKILIHAHHPYSASFLNIYKNFSWRIPILYTVHNTYNNYSLHNKIFTNINLGTSNFITFCGKTSYKAYPYKSFIKKRNKPIPNGVNIKRIDSTIDKVDTNRNDNLILTTISKRNGQKNIPFLIKLIDQLDIDITLKVIGPLDEETKEIKGKNDKSKIIFTGLIERDQVFKEVRKSDVFISASLYEGLPIAVLEAMATSTPMILSDIPSHKEILSKGEGPILLSLSLKKWAKKIKKLNKMEKEELQNIGKKNRDIVEKYFSLDQMHKEYSVIYNELLN